MESNQNADGYWSTADHPAVTALALTAFMGEPHERFKTNAAVKKGYAFLLKNVQPDGGIYRKELQNYNTSLSVLAMVAAKDPKYAATIRNARHWLLGQQVDLN
jgi:squalene-hopene/tetraprenyl-beta-curcumene cyclase